MGADDIAFNGTWQTTWLHAVKTVVFARDKDGISAALRKAEIWQRNLGFDKFKLLEEADIL
jgi:hypothetical protein